jgi:hypothetical protein
VGPDIRKLILDKMFETTMLNVEREAWIALKDVISKFLGNYRDQNFKNIVNHMLDKFKTLGCNMSLKVHFLDSHLDYLPTNLGAVSEEQGERFHEDIKEMERRYQGRWKMSKMADNCWMLQREGPEGLYKWKLTKHSFESKRLRFHKQSVRAE